MSAAQFALILFAGATVWYLFLTRGKWLFVKSLFVLSQLFAARVFYPIAFIIIWSVRAILVGYCVYLLTLFLLSFSRIQEFSDIWLLLSCRPSTFGGRGVISVLVGIIFAGWAYSGGDVREQRIIPEKGDRQLSEDEARAQLEAMWQRMQRKPKESKSLDSAQKALRPKPKQ